MKGSVGSRCAQINHVAHQEDIEHAYKFNIDLTEDVITYKLKNPVYLIFFQSTRSCQIAQAIIEFIILLPGLPQY